MRALWVGVCVCTATWLLLCVHATAVPNARVQSRPIGPSENWRCTAQCQCDLEDTLAACMHIEMYVYVCHAASAGGVTAVMTCHDCGRNTSQSDCLATHAQVQANN